MVKRNKLPGESQFDMRPTKKVSKPIAISSHEPTSSPDALPANPLGAFDLSAWTEANLLSQPPHLRADLYTANPNVTIERFEHGDYSTPRKSPRSRNLNKTHFRRHLANGRVKRRSIREWLYCSFHTP